MLGITSYGVSMTTLEEVFLHLGEEEEVEEDEEEEGGCSWFRGRKIRSSNEDLSHRVLNRYPQDLTHWSAAHCQQREMAISRCHLGENYKNGNVKSDKVDRKKK